MTEARPTSAPAAAVSDGGGPLWAAASVPVGAAVEPHLLASDGAYARALLREFNAITPENAMKWGPVHPTEGGWNFDPADRLVEFAETHGLQIHGHTLVYHDQLPPWVDPGMSRRRMAARSPSTSRPWSGATGAASPRGTSSTRRSPPGAACGASVFLGVLGPGYVADAFRLAHAADPAARLYYNDFDADALGPKADAVYALVGRLLDDGVPVHGVGLQMHLRATHPPASAAIAAHVERLTALGLAVRISEMDVRIRRVRRGDPLARQRRVYEDAIAACAGRPGFAGVTFWGVSDAHSWIHDEFGADAPLLFDRDYAPKPAYFGVRDALAAGRACQAAKAASMPRP